MPASAISSIVVPVVTVLVLSALFRAAQRAPVVAPDGSIRLAYGRGILALGVIVLLFALGAVGLIVKSPPQGRGELLAAIGVVVGFGLGGIYLTAEAWRSALEVSARGIVSISLWRRQSRTFGWDDITSISFSRTTGYLTLGSRGGDRVRVSALYIGFGAFLDLLLERLGPERAARGVEQAKDYLARMRSKGASDPSRVQRTVPGRAPVGP